MSDPPLAGSLARKRVARSLLRILEWSPVERLALISGVLALGGVPYWLSLRAYVADPSSVPYLNPEWARVYFIHQHLFIASWVALALAALWLRRTRRESPVLEHIGLQLFALLVALGTWSSGSLTSLFGAAMLLALTAVGFALFDRRRVLLAIATTLVLVVGATALSLAGLLPYAPAYRSWPHEGNTLPFSTLTSLEGSGFFMMLVSAALIGFLVLLWRDRELALSRALALIRRYVPAPVANGILEGRVAPEAAPSRRRVTVLFADVQGFTEAADQLEPEDLARLLGRYLREMSDLLEARGATISDLLGDGIFAIFGAPEPDPDHARRAVEAAIEMQRRMRELGAAWWDEGIETPFRIRIGINTGTASVGSFGSEGRMVYSAIGIQTNLAARIQAACEPGRILVSHATWGAVNRTFSCSPRGQLEVRGLHYPVLIYDVDEQRQGE